MTAGVTSRYFTDMGLSAGFSTKGFLSVFLSVVFVLFGFLPVAGAQALDSAPDVGVGVSEQASDSAPTIGAGVAAEAPDSASVEDAPRGATDSCENPVPMETKGELSGLAAAPQIPLPASQEDSTAQRMQAIREQLLAEGIEEDDEPLLGAEDLQENIGIPLVFNDAVDHYIHYFTTVKKDLFKRWLKRKRRYAPLVREILREHGLPEDLVYLAMIESGFNLHAYSPMKAAGPWQFIPETGRRYGLTVDHWIDERRDIRKSTVAAARYLKELFDQFDCWYLAAAAYNAGENRIDRLIKRYDTKDFWLLRRYNTLPRETREYVPQLIAAAIIAKDPEKYGLGDIEYVPPLEVVREKVPGGVPLEVVAEAASIDLPSIRTLNPELRRGITPPGKECRIKLPAGTDRSAFQASLSSLLEEGKRVVGVVRHLVKKRDNVQKIAKRYRVSRKDLVLVNGSDLKAKRGEVVYIPQFDGPEREEEPVKGKTAELAKAPNHETGRKKAVSHVTKRPQKTVKKRYHVARKGESLSEIAARYGTTVQSLKSMNRMKRDRVQRGKRLRVSSLPHAHAESFPC